MKNQKRLGSIIGIAMISTSLMLAASCSTKDNADAQMTIKSTPMESMTGMESMAPTMAPMEMATEAPTAAPSAEPTMTPMTPKPTEKATVKPTVKPTASPTAKPTVKPTATMDHSTMATPAPTKAPAASSKSYAVTIKTFAYSPNALTIPVNSEVTFTNKDDVKHTVTAKDGSFKSELIPQDKSYTHKFTEAGVYEIYCEPHTFMTATITVE